MIETTKVVPVGFARKNKTIMLWKKMEKCFVPKFGIFIVINHVCANPK